jgi:lysosomal acid lipase/cholesteryl ester hydrolase
MRVAPIFLLFFITIITYAQLKSADFTQMARVYGFASESHTVNTSDGYILTVFRIPYGNGETEWVDQRQPILLIHGLFSGADSFVINGDEGSIAFYLANQGYDVWAINLRGNYYSRRHISLDPEEIDFWDYDMRDHYYDFSATIEYILQETGYESLSVVGHSHGAT